MSAGPKALYAKLSGTGAIAAVVGNRIGPFSKRPQDQGLPAISYQEIGGSRVRLVSGPSGCASPMYQVNCYADTYGGARDLAEIVRLGIDPAGNEIIGGVKVHEMQVQDHSDDFEPPRSGHGHGDAICFVPMTVRVWHVEATS